MYPLYIHTHTHTQFSFDISKCYSVSTNADSAIAAQESTEIFEEETPNKVKKVELEIQSDKEDSSTSTNSDVGKSLLILFLPI